MFFLVQRHWSYWFHRHPSFFKVILAHIFCPSIGFLWYVMALSNLARNSNPRIPLHPHFIYWERTEEGFIFIFAMNCLICINPKCRGQHIFSSPLVTGPNFPGWSCMTARYVVVVDDGTHATDPVWLLTTWTPKSTVPITQLSDKYDDTLMYVINSFPLLNYWQYPTKALMTDWSLKHG